MYKILLNFFIQAANQAAKMDAMLWFTGFKSFALLKNWRAMMVTGSSWTRIFICVPIKQIWTCIWDNSNKSKEQNTPTCKVSLLAPCVQEVFC